jgi:hypothetical protein
VLEGLLLTVSSNHQNSNLYNTTHTIRLQQRNYLNSISLSKAAVRKADFLNSRVHMRATFLILESLELEVVMNSKQLTTLLLPKRVGS